MLDARACAVADPLPPARCERPAPMCARAPPATKRRRRPGRRHYPCAKVDARAPQHAPPLPPPHTTKPNQTKPTTTADRQPPPRPPPPRDGKVEGGREGLQAAGRNGVSVEEGRVGAGLPAGRLVAASTAAAFALLPRSLPAPPALPCSPSSLSRAFSSLSFSLSLFGNVFHSPSCLATPAPAATALTRGQSCRRQHTVNDVPLSFLTLVANTSLSCSAVFPPRRRRGRASLVRSALAVPSLLVLPAAPPCLIHPDCPPPPPVPR